jgi:predicted RNase H-like nuclease (RuvC/YqgF family)
MPSSSASKENPLADSINPYMRELTMHPKELLLKDGELQIKDVQVSKGEGSLKARMEALEQEVFKYNKMAECEVDIIHRINQELVTKYKKETTELWKDIFSLHKTTSQLQAQLYDLQNQNCEYEARCKQMSPAASFRTLETKTSFLDGGPLPWKYDTNEDSPPSPKE